MEALRQRGVEPAAVEWFNSGEHDFALHLSRIEAAGADIVVMVASAAESVQLVNAMASRQRPLPIISHWGVSSGNQSAIDAEHGHDHAQQQRKARAGQDELAEMVAKVTDGEVHFRASTLKDAGSIITSACSPR